VTESFGSGCAAVGGAHDHLDERVAGLVDGHFAGQHAGHVNIDVLAHGPERARVARDLDHRHDRIADHVALTGGEGVDHRTARRHQRHAFRSCRRRIHEVEPVARFRLLGRVQDVDELRRPADLLEIAQRLLLNRRQPALDVAFRRLAVRQIISLVGEDDVILVGLPHLVPAFPTSSLIARFWQICSAPVISEVSPKNR
jgi:hypothetical protein